MVWGDNTDQVREIVTAVIARHHKGCVVDVEAADLEDLVQGDGGAGASAVLDKLTPVFYSFQDLPLKIAGVAGVGPHAR